MTANRRLRLPPSADRFYPWRLFANGEAGVWYDPNDLDTINEDICDGTQFYGVNKLGRVDSPIGTLFDKSQLGSGTFREYLNTTTNLVSSLDDFSVVGTGTWVTAGNSSYTFTDTAGTQDRPGIALPDNTFDPNFIGLYYIKFNFDAASFGDASQLRITSYSGPSVPFVSVSEIGNVVETFIAPPTSPGYTFRLVIEDGSTSINDTFTISEVEVKAVPGYHAFAPSAANRPRVLSIVPDGANAALTVTPNLLNNPLFIQDTDWIKSNATISGNVANFSSAPNGSYIRQIVDDVITDKWYEVSFDIVTRTAGAFKARLGTVDSADFSTNATHTSVLKADGTDFYIMTSGTTTGTIDNVSLKQLNDDIVLNGTFDSDISNWTNQSEANNTPSWQSGILQNLTTSSSGTYQSFTDLVDAQWYYAYARAKVVAGANVVLTVSSNTANISGDYGSNTTDQTTFQELSVLFQATESNATIYLQTDGAGTSQFDDVRLREVPESEILADMDFDGSDDYLVIKNLDRMGRRSTLTCVTYPEASDRFVLMGDSGTFDYVLQGNDADGSGSITSFPGDTDYRKDGVTWFPGTRNSVHDSLTDGRHVVAVESFDMSNTSSITLGRGENPAEYLNGKLYEFVLSGREPSFKDRYDLERHLGAKHTVPITRGPFTPAVLFEPQYSANGMWIDLEDTDSIVENLDGTGKPDVDDPVAHLIDKAFLTGLSINAFLDQQTEAITNGGFDADTDWTKGGSATISGGVGNLTATSDSLTQDISSAGNDWYMVTFDFVRSSGTNLRVRISNSTVYDYDMTVLTTPFKAFIKAGASGSSIEILSNDFVGTVDNVSAKEVPGSHISVDAASERPLWRSDGSIEFDGIDDSFYQLGPKTSLGDTWTHIGVWRPDNAGTLFGTTSADTGSLRDDNAGAVAWANVAGTGTTPVTDFNPRSNTHVLTFCKTAGNTATVFWNGQFLKKVDDLFGGGGTGICIGAQDVTDGTGGYLDGKFLGGLWIDGTLKEHYRRDIERYYGKLAGIDVDSEINWNPGSLFTTEEGGWYDANDLTSMWVGLGDFNTTTSLGDHPVDGDKVGIWLDKRNFGGKTAVQYIDSQTNLTPGGDFQSSVDYTLNAGWSVSGDEAHGTTTTQTIDWTTTITIGQWYIVTYDITAYTSGSVAARLGNKILNENSAVGSYTSIGKCIDNTTFSMDGITAFTGSIDNVVVKEIDGNHAVSLTNAQRPTLGRDAAGKHYVEFNDTNTEYMVTSDTLSAPTQGIMAAATAILDNSSTEYIAGLISSTGERFYLSYVTGNPSGGWDDIDNATLQSASTHTTDPITMIMYGNGTNVDFYENAFYADTATSTAAPTLAHNFMIGAYNNDETAAGHSDVKIYNLVVLMDQAISVINRARLDNYLRKSCGRPEPLE